HTSTTTVLGREVVTDPLNRSICTVPPDPTKHPGKTTLSLEGLSWSDWGDLCKKLVDYMGATRLPYDEETIKTSERRLGATGYFSAVRCTVNASGGELDCAMTPRPIVRNVSIDGE